MAKRKTYVQEADAETDSIQFNVRLPRVLLVELDAWLCDLNQGKCVGLVNRSELVRTLIDRGTRERPAIR